MKIRESIQQFEKNESKPPHSSLDRHLVQPQHPGQPLHHQYAPPPAPSVHQQYPQHQQQPPPPFSSNQMPPQLTNPHVQLATQLTVTNRSQPGVRRKRFVHAIHITTYITTHITISDGIEQSNFRAVSSN